MSGFPIIDLVAGIIFVFFLLSIICSSAVEVVLTSGKFRARMLEEWLLKIFDKEMEDHKGNKIPLGQAIMDHCTTTGLSADGKATAYIDARNFTSALLEKITYDPKNPNSVATDLTHLITDIENSDLLSRELKRVFLAYANETKEGYEKLTVKVSGQMEIFKSKIENWYDTSMDRVSGSLKTKHTRRFTFWLAVLIVFGLNADTISIAKYLYKNPEARTHLAAQAYDAGKSDTIKKQVATIIARRDSKNDSTKLDSVTVKQLTDSLTMHIEEIKMTKALLDDAIPLGWTENTFKKTPSCGNMFLQILSKLAGLLVTVFAIMMGAPFWFDVLNKISNMRGSGAKPPDSNKK